MSRAVSRVPPTIELSDYSELVNAWTLSPEVRMSLILPVDDVVDGHRVVRQFADGLARMLVADPKVMHEFLVGRAALTLTNGQLDVAYAPERDPRAALGID